MEEAVPPTHSPTSYLTTVRILRRVVTPLTQNKFPTLSKNKRAPRGLNPQPTSLQGESDATHPTTNCEPLKNPIEKTNLLILFLWSYLYCTHIRPCECYSPVYPFLSLTDPCQPPVLESISPTVSTRCMYGLSRFSFIFPQVQPGKKKNVCPEN